MNTTDVGQEAERFVAEQLKKQGYQILENNWKTAFAEIDIVATKNDQVYFVEVKYRTSPQAGDGFDYITAKKLQHMQRAAEAWVNVHAWTKGYELLAAAVVRSKEGFELDVREV